MGVRGTSLARIHDLQERPYTGSKARGRTLVEMKYETYEPHADLASLVKCYWTLEVPAQPDAQKQRIVPDGCIEMAFLFGDDIKRYTSGQEFVMQPREMVIGQITETMYIEPTGHVDSFAVRFYPYGFAGFVQRPIETLVNRETPLAELFGEEPSRKLSHRMNQADTTTARIAIVEEFLLGRLREEQTIDSVVKTTIEALLATQGSGAIRSILGDDAAKRRQLEREFKRKIGMSPKQLGKVIRLQTALKRVLNRQSESLTEIAYESEYYDQAHFTKDFKEFTGTTPRKFLGSEEMALSTLFYK
jgi:AraC-like DNA-binding protein